MKCQKCQKEIFLPFKCQYCGGNFCSEHRLPENHECPQIEEARIPKQETPSIIIQKHKPHKYTITYGTQQPTKRKIHFSNKEIQHLTIGALLVAGVGLSFGALISSSEYLILASLTLILTTSFFIHEIAHKIAAQKKGLWAEFRLTLIGAIITLISILPTPFKFISPGAVMVAGFANRKDMGKISIAGPATNILLSTAFLAASSALSGNSSIILVVLFGAFLNAWIAVFNLIPFGILDGFKVFQWDKRVWVLAFAASLALTIISYEFLF
jgi:Zn-dependent protease